jgi:ubiquinone/menaquinone biosynthesis C-methylase UbiE
MLNPAFSNLVKRDDYDFILNDDISSKVIQGNQEYNTGLELRLDKCYTNDIWTRLNNIGIDEAFFNDKVVFDICSGTGFLTYHLLQRCKPKKVILMDISSEEVESSKVLLSQFKDVELEFRVGDVLKSGLPDNSFDIVIGNSFLHHFYNLPEFIKESYRLTKEKGCFISLHEPTPAAVFLESANWKKYIKYLLLGDSVLESMRYKGEKMFNSDGSDVWIFMKKDLSRLFSQVFNNKVIIRKMNIFKPYVVGKKALHLSKDRPTLTSSESNLISNSVKVDSFLSKILPSKCFGSLVIRADK